MKLSFFIFATLLLVTSNIVFAQSNLKKVKLNQKFEIAASQKGYIQSEKLTVEFVKVLEDSRCPVDVDCVWAGSAKIQIKVSKGKAAAQVFELNTNLEPQLIKFQGYKIELTDLTPAPKSDVDMKSVKYTASFKVEK